MTGDFPPDILKLAESVVDRGYDEGLVDAVCAALLAERERATRVQIERIAQFIDDDFHWILPMYGEKKGDYSAADVNGLTDDAACSVQEQIVKAVRSQLTGG